MPVNPVKTTVITPNVTPATTTLGLKKWAKFIPAPSAKAKKGIGSDSPGFKKLRISGSRLPSTIPMPIGKSTAINAIIGNFAPSIPKAIRVKKGPSFKERTATAPTSERLPYWPVRAAYIPPLPLVIAAMIAMVDRPRKPFIISPESFPQMTPTIRPVKYLDAVSRMPFFMATPPTRRFIWLPQQKRKRAISVSAPVLNKDSVNPPIRRNS